MRYTVILSALGTLIIVLTGLLLYIIRKMRGQYRILEQTNKQLAEVDRLKTEFLANVSHELRTPLTVIMGYSELLLEKLIIEPERATDFRYVETIHRKSEDLLNLINDLIELSRIESGRVEMNIKRLSLDEVVRETVEELSTSAAKKEHAVHVVTGPRPLLIKADRGKIKQIISNLLQNAIKYTPKNGKITIRLYSRERKNWIEVEDNGIGIAPEMMEHLYQPFKQGDSSYNKKYEGFGLGLAITKNLVLYHSGTIDVKSTPGIGTTFIVSLPAAEK
ncbi:sensor histidine kinase [Aneurinibacillus terranovensis]|uniref:sensor histidine kinase n=1 Tax=Aneurinibacillus terranovensis TaxID=278991 RepID=UPI0003FDF316|nr:ATP-binding protein [Aneurinibacillus terranovensis]